MPLPSGCVSGSHLVFQRPALVVGHPGHELRVFGWMVECKPRVCVITDGSGRNGASRTSSTADLLARVGASRGEVFGCVSDADIYRAMLERNVPAILPLVDALAGSFLRHKIDCVVGDAAEGFNPTHDLCRGLANSAVLLAERTSGRRIANFEVCLSEWEQNGRRPQHDDRCVHWTLDDRRLEQKIAAAEQYAELSQEVQSAIAQQGKQYFRVECLRRTETAALPHFDGGKPAYEIWGEQRVAEGHYQTVIRFQQHLLPMLEAILDYASHTMLDLPPKRIER